MSYVKNLNKYYKKHLIPSFDYSRYKSLKQEYKYFMIIPVYNEYEYILNTLDSINNNQFKYLCDLLVVLVINNSKDAKKILLSLIAKHINL